MGSFILRGISTALLVTALTLLAGIGWNRLNIEILSIAQLLDIGLLASCLAGGFRTARESGQWLLGGIVGAGYVIVGTILLALFLPIRVWGFVQILAEGALIGFVAGALGAGGIQSRRVRGPVGKRMWGTPSYADYGWPDIPLGAGQTRERNEADQKRKEGPVMKWTENEEKDLDGSWISDHAEKRSSMVFPDSRNPGLLLAGEAEDPSFHMPVKASASLSKSSKDVGKPSQPWWEDG